MEESLYLPNTGELIELDDNGIAYLKELIDWYIGNGESGLQNLREIVAGLTKLSMINQEKDMLLDYIRINLSMVDLKEN